MVAAIGSNVSRFPQTGTMVPARYLYSIFFFYLTIIIDSGHVWYAVDPENMTEKVGSTRVPLPLALILLLG